MKVQEAAGAPCDLALGILFAQTPDQRRAEGKLWKAQEPASPGGVISLTLHPQPVRVEEASVTSFMWLLCHGAEAANGTHVAILGAKTK